MLSKFGFLSLLVGFVLDCAHQRQAIVNRTNDLVHVWFEKGKEVKAPDIEMDPTLKPYIGMFLADAKQRDVTIDPEAVAMLRVFKYVNTLSTTDAPGVMAACTRFYTYETTKSGHTKVRWTQIEVLRHAVDNYAGGEELRLRFLVYHELYHCFLNKGHLPPGMPGIMAPILNPLSDRDLTDPTGLVDEMFSPAYLKATPNED